MPYEEDILKESLEDIRNRVIGFGEASFKKSYYPQLQYKEDELKRFRIALDSISDLVFILDYPSLDIIDTNRRAVEVLDYVRNELLKMNFRELTDNNLPDYVLNLLDSPKKTVNLIKADFFAKNGTGIHMEVSISLAGMGKETYAAVVCRDVTEREIFEKTIRESEHQYRTTINTLKDIVVVIDSSLDVVIFNEAFENLCKKTGLKYSCESKNIKSLLKHFHYEGNKNLLDSSFYMNFFEINLKYRYNGNLAIYSAKNMPIFENGIFKQSVLYMRDITKYSILDEMKKEAFMQIDKNMEQFAVLNDHIRNPLQVILGIIDLECPETVDKIMPHVIEIDRIINRLDNGWIESEKVRKMIAKHYGVSLIDNSDMQDAINYLRDKII